MNLRESWLLFAVGSAFFAGLTALFAKLGVAGINSNLATLIRTVVIIAMLALIVSLRGEWRPDAPITTRSWVFLILSGVATGLSWLCYFRALQLGPISKVAPIDKLSVAFAIFFGVLFVGEAFSWPVAIGGALIIAGSVVMIVF
ncbi:MAG: EamA family transporter [Xanthomonadales bacterium]|nr:EamA family transporter [Xanthomonadales bacterium]